LVALGEQNVADTNLEAIYVEEASLIIQNVAQLTQEQLAYHIDEPITLALASVFENPYEFKTDFVPRRNRTEADLRFVRGGRKIDPMSASEGGAIDVASFALRAALWRLRLPKSRNTFLLDEPLHFLKGEDTSGYSLPEKGALMLSEISKKLKIQLIMISHIPEQVAGADKVHRVTQREGVSKVV
jgi:hypothetical protein